MYDNYKPFDMKKDFFLVFGIVVCSLGTSTFSFAQSYKSTYKVSGTTYIYGQTYSTTGQPKVQRSSTAKKEFLNSRGYKSTPKGYQIDHVIPLSQGGRDVPSNMQLLTIDQHKAKTAYERKSVSSAPIYTTPKLKSFKFK